MKHHRKILLFSLVAVLLIAGLSFGLVTAYAQGQEELPALTPPELLAKVAEAAGGDVSVSGEFTVTNELLGPLSGFLPGGFGMGGASMGPAALLQGGSGRVWLQDGQARVDVFGTAGGDTSVYASKDGITVYDAGESTLTQYLLPDCETDHHAEGLAHDIAAPADMQASIADVLHKIAPTASVTVTGQETVAGRDSYILSLAPESTKSLFGSLMVAVDGETFLPLRLEVYARGGTEPAFSAGFTEVSFDSIDTDVFAVPSPPGIETDTKEIQCPFDGDDGDGPSSDFLQSLSGLEPLDLADAEAEAGFDLLAPAVDGLAQTFQGAYVIELPVEQAEVDVSSLEGPSSGMPGLDLLGGFSGPMVILVYGQGFDTVVLVETPLASNQADALGTLLGQVPLFGEVSVNDQAGYEFTTPLSSLLLWGQNDVGVLVMGGLPAADLEDFAADVR